MLKIKFPTVAIAYRHIPSDAPSQEKTIRADPLGHNNQRWF
ncbi:hypothetical protein [Thermoleptolyngbya sp. PKUAC-SCTB121]|nr:hypothetical protein [Thermoleptolyngbya sp. PKUAC-SCTB121]